MKKNLTIIKILIFIFNVNYFSSQRTTVVENVKFPTALFVYNNDIFYGEHQGSLLKNTLNTISNPSIVWYTNGTYRSTFKDNYLYVTNPYGGEIVKIDLTSQIYTPVSLFKTSDTPDGIAIKGNDLYFSLEVSGTIAKIDISEVNPVMKIVASGFSDPTGIAIHGNNLYVAEFNGNRISKLDISSDNPVRMDYMTELNNPTEILVYEDKLLVSEFSNNRILLVNIDNTTPVIIDTITNITQPTGLFINNSDLYVCVYGENKIIKMPISTLNVQNNSSIENIILYPNPSSDFVTITGISKPLTYEVNNYLGVKVMKGTITNKSNIDIRNLPIGVYFIILENGISKKIIKK